MEKFEIGKVYEFVQKEQNGFVINFIRKSSANVRFPRGRWTRVKDGHIKIGDKIVIVRFSEKMPFAVGQNSCGLLAPETRQWFKEVPIED